jgi:hypothetical protein
MGDAVARWQARSSAMRGERFSARVLDAGGAFGPERQAEARAALDAHGAVHVTNTGLDDAASLVERLPGLGFAPHEQFSGGGRTTSARQEKWALPGLRRMDHYPASLFLLPNNEVQYQRPTPERVLFFVARPPDDGGRVFLHSARAVEEALVRAGPVGARLVDKLPLGDGTELDDRERAVLLDAYLETREGVPLVRGDVLLFDNIRFGHSRESYSGEREVLVGMAGLATNGVTPSSPWPTTTKAR